MPALVSATCSADGHVLDRVFGRAEPSTAQNLEYAAGAIIGVGGALLVSSIVMLVEGKTRYRFSQPGWR